MTIKEKENSKRASTGAKDNTPITVIYLTWLVSMSDEYNQALKS